MRTALVTGANRGLGLETSRQLETLGFRVLRTSREGDWRLDVADRESIAALAQRLRDEAIRLDLLVNNAGISLRGFNAEIARRTLEVNFFGVMHVTDALLPVIDDGGMIVMVSSGLGELDGLPPELLRAFSDPSRAELIELMNQFLSDVEAGRHQKNGWPSSAYRVSKIGLNALTRALAREQPRLRANAVCPGWVRTDMGGSGAPRSVAEGAASIVATASQESGPTGRFFRDGATIDW